MDDVLTQDTKAFDEKLTDERPDVDFRELQLEKEKLDKRYKTRLEELEKEKREQERLYDERIVQFRKEDQYKDELIRSQINKIAEEKSKIDGTLNHRRNEVLSDLRERENRVKERIQNLKLREEEKDNTIREKIADLEEERNKKVEKRMDKIRELQEEIREIEEEYHGKTMDVSKDMSYKKDILRERQEIDSEIETLKKESDFRIKEWQMEKDEQEKLIKEREATLKNELESTNRHSLEKVTKLEELKRQQLDDINSKVQVLLREKMKCDELYSLKIEKLKQDNQYRNREQNLKEQIQQQENLYQTRLRDFEQKRIEREEHLEKESKPERVTGLIRLKDMKGYKVAKGDSDVRGWNVLGSNNDKIGKVKELIIDPELMKVRYLDIKVIDDLIIDNSDERHLLIPIGVAVLDEDDDNVLLPTLDSNMVAKLPQVTGDSVTRDYEHTLLTALSSDFNPELYSNERFYDHSNFDDTRFYSSRRGRS